MKSLLVTLALGAALFSIPALAAADHGASQTSAGKPDLTRQQAQERADVLFDMFDANHDGSITRAEAQQVREKLMVQHASTGKDMAPGIGGHTLKFLERAFSGADSVSRQQLEQAMLAHFDEMDLNHDGIVTAAERAQLRAQHQQAMGKASQ